MSPSMRSTADVTFSGPFFQRDPAATFWQNLDKMMEGIADEGERAAREGLLTGAGSRALVRETGDRVADHVVGRVSAVSGKDWVAAAVVGVNTQGLDATASRSLMAAASYVERRTAAIRRVTRQLNASRAVLRANLTQGLE